MAPTIDDRIEQLLRFEAQEGHLFVPQTHKKDGLGKWVDNMRYQKKNGKIKKNDTISRLDEIGFVWEVPKGPAKQELIKWGKHFKFVVNFHKTKGHCNIPSKIAGKSIPAAAWCDQQRSLFLEQKLEQDKVDKLSKLNFDFYWSGEEVNEPVRLMWTSWLLNPYPRCVCIYIYIYLTVSFSALPTR
jgi:hypothetical protein